MKNILQIMPIVGCLCGFANSARADFAADVGAASEKVMPLLTDASAMLVDGRFDEANQKILAVFPEKTRSAAQAFVLANVLYSQNPKESYKLHKRAAHDLPDDPQVQYEWAMEQHRAGEYAGAAASYAVFSKAHPQQAPAYGLCAECLLRSGKTKEAVVMWKKSEEAPQGTLIDLEELVCSVNSHLFPDRDRAEQLTKANAGDIGAAEKLIALDCGFERDWWNKSIKLDYLKHDLQTLRKSKFADVARINEILCAGDCALARDDDGAAVGGVLRNHNFFVGEKPKLPESGSMLSIMLGRAVITKAIPFEEAKTKWGPAILDQAKSAKDVAAFRVALCANTEQLPEIDETAWTATGDVQFAASFLVHQDSLGKLKLDDPLLTAAAQKFPDDAVIAGLTVRLTAKANKPLETALVNAIKGEYHRFSPGSHAVGVDFPRPGAELLAAYFAKLERVIANK